MDTKDCPYQWFDSWFADAERAGEAEPSAMVLATVNDRGNPTARVVLYRGRIAEGFCFYTNYQSQKGQELAAKPVAAAVFYWPKVGRQIRIEGSVERLKSSESDAYFRSRPRRSQLGAWASAQSQSLSNRQTLFDAMERLEAQYQDELEVPRPPHWGGYRLVPNLFEFWQGDLDRLHWRWQLRSRPDETENPWDVRILSP